MARQPAVPRPAEPAGPDGFQGERHGRTSMNDTGFDAVTTFFERCAVDDVEGAVACFTLDGLWIMPNGPEPGTTYRREQMTDHLNGLIELRKKLEVQGMHLEFDEPMRAGDRVVVESRLLDAADKVVDRGVDVFTLKDGLIAVKDVYRKA
ncbi:hypothetical protein CTZ27_09830 [Streptomyces griseocarneus]|nr:hypothetical protein CTZ27_09830 [Streptomyces griseocarneus]